VIIESLRNANPFTQGAFSKLPPEIGHFMPPSGMDGSSENPLSGGAEGVAFAVRPSGWDNPPLRHCHCFTFPMFFGLDTKFFSVHYIHSRYIDC